MPSLTNSEKGKSDLNIISASVMCIDMLNFRDQLRALDDAGIDLYHIDVMDGHFVPNYALSPCTMRDIAKVSSTAMDVHLMVDNPDSYISAFADAGASIITPHLETLTHPIRTLKLIRSLGKKAGIAINPATDIAPLAYMTDFVDLVCVMTVDPGFAGQQMIPSAIDKIAKVRSLFSQAGRKVDIMVDGHVETETAPKMVAAGANVLVMGSSGLFHHEPRDYKRTIDFFKNL